MPRVFLGNFDFESRLSSPGGGASFESRRRNAELSFAWLAIAEPDDVIVSEGTPPEEFVRALEALGLQSVRFMSEPVLCVGYRLVPWGWTVDVARWAARYRLEVEHPPFKVVAFANSRRFSFAWEKNTGTELEGQLECNSVSGVEQAIANLDEWLIKGEFAASGRDRVRGRGLLSAEDVRWIERRLKKGRGVFVEPYVERLDEAGLQWEIPRRGRGEPRLAGITPLMVDSEGQYRGSLFATDEPLEEKWSFAVDTTRQVASELQQLGYFGSLGIDAMQYRDAIGNVRIRPLQDVNARWTMGRLSLGCQRWIQAGETGAFRQGPGMQRTSLPLRRRIALSPEILSGCVPTHHFWVEIGQPQSFSGWNPAKTPCPPTV